VPPNRSEWDRLFFNFFGHPLAKLLQQRNHFECLVNSPTGQRQGLTGPSLLTPSGEPLPTIIGEMIGCSFVIAK
jgi:hypothetical protein